MGANKLTLARPLRHTLHPINGLAAASAVAQGGTLPIRCPTHAAQCAHSISAWASTVFTAASCRSGG
jgi:hypothetical protein